MKSRIFCAILYPEEDPSHLFCMQLLKSARYQYLAIDHDRSLKDDGQVKKLHTHVLIKFKNPRSLSAVAFELGVDDHYIQHCQGCKEYMLYMIHYGYPDKESYDISDCYGTLVPELMKHLSNDSESVRVLGLIDLLDQMPKPCSYRTFLVACCQNELYSEFRRLGIGVTKLLEEHNGIGFWDGEKK